MCIHSQITRVYKEKEHAEVEFTVWSLPFLIILFSLLSSWEIIYQFISLTSYYMTLGWVYTSRWWDWEGSHNSNNHKHEDQQNILHRF